MSVQQMVSIVDRMALSLMNTIVFIGLPLVAAGLLTQRL